MPNQPKGVIGRFPSRAERHEGRVEAIMAHLMWELACEFVNGDDPQEVRRRRVLEKVETSYRDRYCGRERALTPFDQAILTALGDAKEYVGDNLVFWQLRLERALRKAAQQ